MFTVKDFIVTPESGRRVKDLMNKLMKEDFSGIPKHIIRFELNKRDASLYEILKTVCPQEKEKELLSRIITEGLARMNLTLTTIFIREEIMGSLSEKEGR